MGHLFGAFLQGVKSRGEHKAAPFTDGRLFRHEEPKRMETFPSPLIQLQTWLTLTEFLVSMLSCYSVRSYELTDFLSSKSACQLLAEFPPKRKGCPARRQDFSTCRNREQAKLIHRLCFIMRSMRNTFFTEKFRPLNSRGEESSQPLLYPSLLPLLIAFLLVTLEKFCSAGRPCKYQRGHCQRQTWRHQRDHQKRCLSTEGCTSQLYSAWPFSPRCELGTKSSRNGPQGNKVLQRTEFREICWHY